MKQPIAKSLEVPAAAKPAAAVEAPVPEYFKVTLKRNVTVQDHLYKAGSSHKHTVDKDTLDAMGDAVDASTPV